MALPPEAIQFFTVMSAAFAPTPTATPRPPQPTPTPIKTMFCPDDPYVLPAGSICRGAEPLPTATPLPTYPACTTPAQPQVTCQVRYGVVGVPTPTATPLAVILSTPLPVMYQGRR